MRFVSTRAVVLAATVALPGVLAAQTFTTHKYNIGGEGGTDYLSADPSTGRVYISRGTHVMVVDGATGKVVGDIPNTPRVHGIAFAPKSNHGFTTNAGDSTSTMFDLKTLEVIKRIPAGINGLDGIMYDEATDKILTINHSSPMGSATVIDPNTGTVVAQVALTGKGPEGGVGDGNGHIFINLEDKDKNAIDVVDTGTWKVTATWPISPCEGPTGIALDRENHRIFSGCDDTSVVVNAVTGKVVAKLVNGGGVDALAWDPVQKLIYIPAGESGEITVVHQESADIYKTVATVKTMVGAKTITVDPATHVVYVFTPEYGPPPARPAGSPPPKAGARPARGPMIGAWFISVIH
jgi:hypothetical protein